MAGTVNIEGLLDDLADRVADRLAERMTVMPERALSPRLLTVEQAATYLGRSKASVQHMVSEGSLPTVRSDRRVFLDIQDLDRWIDRHKKEG